MFFEPFNFSLSSSVARKINFRTKDVWLPKVIKQLSYLLSETCSGVSAAAACFFFILLVNFFPMSVHCLCTHCTKAEPSVRLL